MTTDDIRQQYLDFFRDHGHAVIPGAPLVPENDPTVLFTTAGMHPLVPYLLGEAHPAGKRLVDVQRCVRTQDIDEVGDESHLTMFEMLGRWSLGEYFKEGAIEMSFEFLTRILEMPLEMLAVSCFEGDAVAPKDSESAGYWKKMGIPEERIGFLPKAKNWWGPAGAAGPCGPDSEMFYWIGEGKPRGNPATHEKEWLEIGNDVFIQYTKTPKGTFEPLRQKNVDEGMGLDRLAWILQREEGARNVFETDRMKPILEAVFDLQEHSAFAAKNRDEEQIHREETRAARIITDHLRAATFIIADGVSPSNVDQGYVLRRLIRRAIRSARTLGIEHRGEFGPGIARAVMGEYGEFYAHLHEREAVILATLKQEEEQFGKTLQEGLKRFEKVMKEMSGSTIDGMAAFHLYDTYGFPLELTKEMAKEQGLNVDEAGFKKSFEEHQDKSRAGAEKKFKGGLADHSAETTKLHTATHLLNAALQKVLGDHVSQKGSNITAQRLRFDFNHPEKMTPEQIKAVEKLVNDAIKADLPVSYHTTTVEGAKKEGAIGVFDERYGNEVKVYVVGPSARPTKWSSGRASSGQDPWNEPFSKEICGGPHVARAGMLGSFTIQKEESSSAGIRRIKAVVEGGPKEIEAATEA
ncbi:alanine--tRNA ligase [Candidatus Peregrinibacteria bacterium]|nr:alanine--tRNA ligase [Candidatus Peregrinibacteria bacterium]